MKSSVAALALLASTAHALSLTAPSDVHSASPITVSWTSDSSDPSLWSLFLVNDVFHNTYAILNPVNNSASSATFTLPPVPAGDGYTLQATPLGNLTVLATSGSFSIAAQASSASASLSTAASGSGTASAPPSATPLPSGSSLITPSGSVTGSVSGSVIVVPTGSVSVSGSRSVSVSGSLSGSASGSGAPSPSQTTGGAKSLSAMMGPWLAAGLAVIAGAMAL